MVLPASMKSSRLPRMDVRGSAKRGKSYARAFAFFRLSSFFFHVRPNSGRKGKSSAAFAIHMS